MADQNLRVRLLAVTAGFSRGMNTASNQLKAFGSKAKAVGSSLKSIQLPLALAGGAAVKLAVDFDKSMTQIESLVGISADKVAQMGEAAKKMAKDTGQSATDAADALFFITSAGLRGDEAMQVLEASLKSASIGLGEAKTVADLATSAMNAYGSEVLSATGATDVLGAAVREGKLEASELAGAMGRVLPMASNMGIQFHEVGAAFAAMSRTGTNANEAATQLNAIMQAIMKPTEGAKEAFDTLGLSTEGLRKQIKEKGLLSVFQTLKEASLQNAAAFETAFGPMRATRGVLDLLGAGFESTQQIFENMNNTAGFTADAFAKVEQSASFKLQKALNSVKVSFTQLGATILGAILPYIEKLSNFVVTLFNAFQNLNPTVKGLVLAAGGLALVLPTVLSLLGTIAGALGALISPVGLVIAAFAAVGYAIVKNWEPVKKTIVDVINYVIGLYNESVGFRIVIQSIGAIFKSIFDIGKSVFQGLWNIVKAVGQNFITQFKSVGKVIEGIFTLDANLIKQGVEDSLKSGFNTITTIVTEAGNQVMSAGEIIHDNLKTGFEKALVADPIEFVTENDVDNFVSGIKDKVVSAGEKIAGLFQGGVASGSKGAAPETAGEAQPFQLGSFGGATAGLNLAGESLNLIGNSVDSVTQKFERMKEFVSENADLIGESLFNAFNTLIESENPLKALGQMIMQLVKKLLAAAAAAFILSALLPGMGATSFKGGGVDFKSIMGSFTGMKFANGGIVSTPTLGMVGEYSGARSNPEVIAPLDRLKSLIGDAGVGQKNVQVGGEFRLRGEDLLVSLERAEKQRNRTS